MATRSAARAALSDVRLRRRQRASWLLVAAGSLSALNGAAHLVLPLLYPAGGWAQHVEGVYEPVRWALFATTVFFAILLILAGGLTILLARASDVPRPVAACVVGGMAAFWGLAAAYEIVVPFPVPIASWALPLFSIGVAALHLWGLLVLSGKREHSDAEGTST